MPLEKEDIPLPPNAQAMTIRTEGCMSYAMSGPGVGVQFVSGPFTSPIYSIPADIVEALCKDLLQKAKLAQGKHREASN